MGLLDLLFGGSKSAEKLKEVVNKGAFLVDVRSSGEFKSGSVKGAVNIPLDSIQGQLSKFKGKENVVVFCKSGMRSSQAKLILERNGVGNVYNGGTVSKVSNLLSSK